jgi:hypothetical protein
MGQVTTACWTVGWSCPIICMLSISSDRRRSARRANPFTSRGVTLTLNNIAQALRFRWVIGDGRPARQPLLYQVGRTGLG